MWGEAAVLFVGQITPQIPCPSNSIHNVYSLYEITLSGPLARKERRPHSYNLKNLNFVENKDKFQCGFPSKPPNENSPQHTPSGQKNQLH